MALVKKIMSHHQVNLLWAVAEKHEAVLNLIYQQQH